MKGKVGSPLLLQIAGRNNILPPEIQGLITIVFLALTLTFFYYITLKTSPKKQEEKKVTRTILKCMGEEKTEEREFMEGDYVGKIVGKCDENNSTKYIYAIYDVTIGKEGN